MKINREKFLAAALLLAANGGCGKVAEKFGLNLAAASQDPDTSEGKASGANGIGDAPLAGRTGKGKPAANAGAPVAKNASRASRRPRKAP